MISIQPLNTKGIYFKNEQNRKVQQQTPNYTNNSVGITHYYMPYNVSFSARKTNFNAEINEQPQVLKSLCDKCLDAPNGINMDLGLTSEEAKKLTGIRIVASGSSKNAANSTKHFIEKVTNLPVDVQYSGEFAHKNIVANPNDLMIFISQSGETADTFSALKKAKDGEFKTFSLTNVPNSKIHKTADSAIDISAGVEKAVAATKSVTAQLMNLYIMGLKLAELRGTLTPDEIKKYSAELKSIPSGVESIINSTDDVKAAAKQLQDENNIFILARGAAEGAVSEGALKLRETIYVNPVPYNSGEFLHGPIASVDEKTPVIQIIAGNKNDENYTLAKNNVQEVISKRNPEKAFIIKSDKSNDLESNPVFKDVLWMQIPEISEDLSALYSIVKFQLLAKELTILTGKNPDSPRSLTKAVEHE